MKNSTYASSKQNFQRKSFIYVCIMSNTEVTSEQNLQQNSLISVSRNDKFNIWFILAESPAEEFYFCIYNVKYSGHI